MKNRNKHPTGTVVTVPKVLNDSKPTQNKKPFKGSFKTFKELAQFLSKTII